MGKRTKQSELNHDTVRYYLKIGHWMEVDKAHFHDRKIYVDIPNYYRPHHFKCRDCGVLETWTAKQQKWWYEEAGVIYGQQPLGAEPVVMFVRARRILNANSTHTSFSKPSSLFANSVCA